MPWQMAHSTGVWRGQGFQARERQVGGMPLQWSCSSLGKPQVESTPDLDSLLTARKKNRETNSREKIFFRGSQTNSRDFFSWRSISESGDFFWWYFRLRTKMWISRAVMVGFLWFWVIWRATSVLLHLSTTFMGLGATLLPLSPKTLGRFIWN